jgi:hypothetical protein
MEHSLFLRQYKYEIPGSSTAFSGLPAGKEARLINQLPALSAFFDFENGDFQLEADSRFLLNESMRANNPWINNNQERLFINANMKPEIPSGPDDNLRNELLLFLKGSIFNGERQSKCSGLMRLNRNWQSKKAYWTIYFNLVDNDLDLFVIKVRLPVITSLVDAAEKN